MKRQVVIAGAGLGGLFCGAILAKEGYSVLLLDKHHTAGGGLHCFKRYAYLFDTGMHYVTGFEQGGVLQRLCSYLGIFEQLKFTPLDPQAFDALDVASDGAHYEFPLGLEAFTERMIHYFPHQKAALTDYMSSLNSITEPVDFLNLRHSDRPVSYQSGIGVEPLGRFMEQHVSDLKLKDVLLWLAPLYGGNKEYTPAYMHAIISQAFIKGATRFAHGAQNLADALVGMIRAHGGDVRLQEEVVSVRLNESQEIQGVLTKNGAFIEAEQFISTVHPWTSIGWFPEGAFSKAFKSRMMTQKHSGSTFSLFAVLKSNAFPFQNTNRFYVQDYGDTCAAPQWDIQGPRALTLFTAPSGREGDYARTVKICAPISYEPFRKWEGSMAHKRGADYEAFKEQCAAAVLLRASELFPELPKAIEHKFSATPLTYQYYTGSVDGSNYGFLKDCRDLNFSRLLPRTKVSNFFFSGQNLNMHGILGVPLSALITCGEIVGMSSLLAKITQHK